MFGFLGLKKSSGLGEVSEQSNKNNDHLNKLYI